MNQNLSKIKFSASMVIFGTIGLFVRLIPFPSAVISMCRGFLGAAFLTVFILVSKTKFSYSSIKNNFIYLFLSGSVIGFNWILLFESYKYISVAKATLCYYMAPIFIILISPFVFKEKITFKKTVCVIMSFLGILLVSGISPDIAINKSEIKGVVLGLSSAVTYAVIIVLNKKLKDIGVYEKTVVQLLTCGVVMLVYSCFSGDIINFEFTKLGILLMLIVCIFHTGIAYLLYFGTMDKIKAQTIAILSYIDPVVAVVFSAVILKEPLNIYGIIGAVLIIGSALIA